MVSQTSQLMHSDNYDLQHETHSIKLCITSHSIPWKWWKISGLINLYLSKVYCAVLIIYYLVFVLFVSFCSCAAFWSRYLLSLFASCKVQWPTHASLSSITTKFTDNYKTKINLFHAMLYVKISHVQGELQSLTIPSLPCCTSMPGGISLQSDAYTWGLSSPAYLWHQWSAG